MNEASLLAVVVSVFALFGFVIKLVLPRLLNKIDEKDKHIEEITIKFTEVINHKTTVQTEVMQRLSDNVEKNTQTLEKLIK